MDSLTSCGPLNPLNSAGENSMKAHHLPQYQSAASQLSFCHANHAPLQVNSINSDYAKSCYGPRASFKVISLSHGLKATRAALGKAHVCDEAIDTALQNIGSSFTAALVCCISMISSFNASSACPAGLIGFEAARPLRCRVGVARGWAMSMAKPFILWLMSL